MQLLRGSTLESILDHADYATKAPSVGWAAAIAAQIAAVLADVHQVDIVHRDIKAANVMLVDGGLVKILDFGIAILRGAGAMPRLTQVDRTIGTRVHVAGTVLGQMVTSASDIYSLGCLLCELLTGDAPFHGTKDMPLRAHHLQSAAPSVRARRADIPAAVDGLVSSMLAKDLQARPSAQLVYEALLPLATAPAPPHGDESRDPTRPFRRPLLAPARRREQAADGPRLTDTDASQLMANVRVLLDNERPSKRSACSKAASKGPGMTLPWSCGCAMSSGRRCFTPGNTRGPRAARRRRKRLPQVFPGDRPGRPRLLLLRRPRLRRDRQPGQGPTAPAVLRTERRRHG